MPSSSGYREAVEIHELMQSLTGKKIFPGFGERDLDSTVSIPESSTNMCRMSYEKKLKIIFSHAPEVR